MVRPAKNSTTLVSSNLMLSRALLITYTVSRTDWTLTGTHDYNDIPGLMEKITVHLGAPRDTEASAHLPSFSSSGTDRAGPFRLHGKIYASNQVSWIKLYESHGWVYHGKYDPAKDAITGRWGSETGNRGGNFILIWTVPKTPSQSNTATET